MDPRLANAFSAIDAANADDPNTLEVRGEERPKEQAHAELACAWVAQLVSQPSDVLLVAARAHDRSTMDLAAQICDRELTPAAAATMRELARRFEAAIDQLDEQDREVVIMRHFEQLSNQEVAQALALSEPAASMRYLRAIRRLRATLGEPPSEGS